MNEHTVETSRVPGKRPKCADCNKPADLTFVPEEEARPFSGWVWACGCGASAKCIPDTLIPTARPCGNETRLARKALMDAQVAWSKKASVAHGWSRWRTRKELRRAGRTHGFTIHGAEAAAHRVQQSVSVLLQLVEQLP